MRTREQIEAQRDMLAQVAGLERDNPNVAPRVVDEARNLCHTLNWVLDEFVEISPYNVPFGCCCEGRTHDEDGTLHCGIGPGMCMNPGKSPQPPVRTLTEFNVLMEPIRKAAQAKQELEYARCGIVRGTPKGNR